MQGYNESPVNPLPWVVWLLVLPVVAMEAVLSLGQAGLAGGPDAVGWRLEAVQRFGFFPEVASAMVSTRTFPAEHMLRFVSYPLVHGSFTHALFVGVFLLALGKMVGEIYRPLAVLAVVFAAILAGALAYWAVGLPGRPLFGGYPPAYGLIGAFTYILWVRLGLEHANRARAFTLIGFLMGIQLIFGLLFGGGRDWVADLAGFAAGFAVSFLVAPGGWRHALEVLRRR